MQQNKKQNSPWAQPHWIFGHCLSQLTFKIGKCNLHCCFSLTPKMGEGQRSQQEHSKASDRLSSHRLEQLNKIVLDKHRHPNTTYRGFCQVYTLITPQRVVCVCVRVRAHVHVCMCVCIASILKPSVPPLKSPLLFLLLSSFLWQLREVHGPTVAVLSGRTETDHYTDYMFFHAAKFALI